MERADYAVIGAGAFGASTAYHLARRGARNVVLLDRFEVGSQTSPRAAGLCRKVAGTELAARLMDEATERLARFEVEGGHSVNFHRSGSLLAALTPAGERRLAADLERATRLEIPARLISADEARQLAPFFEPGAARSILHSPEDGWVDPWRVAVGFAEQAAQLGVQVRPRTAVREVRHEDGRVRGVRTDQGEIAASVVVDAAGAWSRLVAETAGFEVPLVPTRHQLYITQPLDGVAEHQPTVRILEASVYVRPEQGGLMLGGYEDEPRQIEAGELRDNFQIDDLRLDLGVLDGLTAEVQEHFPMLAGAAIREHRGGLPTMSPDSQYIAGPVPSLGGFYVISGCNVGGLSISPALGRALADLILDGRSEPDLSPYYVERFGERFDDPPELQAACRAAYARKYLK